MQDRLDDESVELSDAEAQALNDELDQLGDQLEAIEQSLTEYAPGVIAAAGVVVSVDHMGGVVVHRGLLREEEAKALRAREREEGGPAGETADPASSPKGGISEKLAKRLSAHRTAALQAEVARHPHVALVALVHRLALSVIVEGYYREGSPVNITAVPQRGLETHAPDIAQSPALAGMLEVRQAWAERLPEDPDALFAELLALPQQELMSLLAVCVAQTVGALSSREDDVPGAALAHAVGLDMHDWWTPTAAGYFEHVAKARALEAVQEFAPDHVERLEKVKKAELASEAERLVAGTGWLPPMFRQGASNEAVRAPQSGESHGERAEDEVPENAPAAG